jgi:uncharacterized protein YjbJ (UPF0337 family)
MTLNLTSFLRRLLKSVAIFLTPMVIMVTLLLGVPTAMAAPSQQIVIPNTLGAMSKKIDAAKKNAEGKLESAYGDLTGDTGHQIKGKVKQIQASATNMAEDVKEGARSVGKKVANNTNQK